jgi:hypothetical protein
MFFVRLVFFFYIGEGSETLNMSSQQLGEMLEGNFADKCGGKFLFMSMGGLEGRVDQIYKKLLGIYSNYLIPFSYDRVNNHNKSHPNLRKSRGQPSELKFSPKIQRISKIYEGDNFVVVFSIFMLLKDIFNEFQPDL